jgi:monoamine oxidase
MIRNLILSLLLVMGVALDADVVIVGAGTSGLVAAKTLIEKSHQLKIHVLEQRDHVGGRTRNLVVPGYPGVIMEGGGTWLGPTQDDALELCQELDLELYHSYYHYPGHDPNSSVPEMYPKPDEETLKWIRKVEEIAKDVGTKAPWAYKKANEYDSITLAEWLEQQGASSGVIDGFNDKVLGPFNCEATEVSFLFYLFIAASCPFDYDAANTGGAQDFRLVKGSQAISLELFKRATAAGVKVHFNTTVSHIANAADGVVISTNKGEFHGKHAIIALGTGDAARLSYDGLTPERRFLHNNWIRGGGIKFFFVFDRAFWREEGMFGKPNFPAGPGAFFYDYTPFNRISPGIIAGFWQGNSTKTDNRAILESLLVSAIGPRVLGNVRSYVEQHWDLNHDGGTANIVQHMSKGVLSKAGSAWRSPIGRLHWAGSDTAQKWMGYISGAVESGHRTAKEVLADQWEFIV